MRNVGVYDEEEASAVRAAFLAIPGNEDGLKGLEPSDYLVDANITDASLRGRFPGDVLTALFQGNFSGGVPEQYQSTAVTLDMADGQG